MRGWPWLVILPCLSTILRAGTPGGSRMFCDDEDPRNRCPGADCFCTDDSLEVTFGGIDSSDFPYTRLTPGSPVTAHVVLDVRSERVTNWTLGVRHDPAILELRAVTLEGTDVEASSFVVVEMQDLLDCGGLRRCEDAPPGHGVITAALLLFEQRPFELRRNTLLRAEYVVKADPGEAGTILEITDELARRSSPPVDINLTVGGKAMQPRMLTDGRLVKTDPGPRFHRGDPDADGRITISDAIQVLAYLYAGGRGPPCAEAADFADDGSITREDAILLLLWLFRGTGAPAPPGPPSFPCGTDPERSPASLGCASYEGC